MSNVLVLVGSARKSGNTELLAQAFANGAKKNNEIDIISVSDINVNPCDGCNACFSTEGNVCIQKDDRYTKIEYSCTEDV